MVSPTSEFEIAFTNQTVSSEKKLNLKLLVYLRRSIIINLDQLGRRTFARCGLLLFHVLHFLIFELSIHIRNTGIDF